MFRRIEPDQSLFPDQTMTRKSGASCILTLCFMVYLLHSLDRQIVSVLLEPLRHEFRLTDSQLGLLSGLAYSAAAILAAVPAGLIADRFPRKVVLIVAVSLWTGLTALCGAANSYALLLLARLGVGATESTTTPACLSMIADSFPPNQRAKAVSIYFASSGFGVLLGFSVGGWVAASHGWRFAFFVAGAPALLLVPALLLFLVEPRRGQAAKRARRIGVGQGIGAIFTNPQLALLLAAMTLAPLGLSTVGTWGTSLLVRSHGLDLPHAGITMALATGLSGPVGQFAGGLIGDRLAIKLPGSQMYFAAASSIFGALIGIAAAMSSATIVTIVCLCCAVIVMMLYIGSTWSLLTQLAPAGTQGTMLAIATMLGNLVGVGGGTLLVGVLSDAIGGGSSLRLAVSLTLMVSLVPGILFALLGYHLRVAHTTGTLVVR